MKFRKPSLLTKDNNQIHQDASTIETKVGRRPAHASGPRMRALVNLPLLSVLRSCGRRRHVLISLPVFSLIKYTITCMSPSFALCGGGINLTVLKREKCFVVSGTDLMDYSSTKDYTRYIYNIVVVSYNFCRLQILTHGGQSIKLYSLW